jgi:hypothetical protein
MPSRAKRSGMMYLPFTRGEEGSRRVFQEASATPIAALEQFGLEKLLNGEVGAFLGGVASGLTDWFGPALGGAYKAAVVEATGRAPTFFGQSIASTDEKYTIAPPYLEWTLKNLIPESGLNYLRDIGWIEPEMMTIENQQTLTGRVMVSRTLMYFLEGIDPRLSVIRRIWPSEDQERQLGSVFGVGKTLHMTEPRVNQMQLDANRSVQETLTKEKSRQISVGNRPK